MWHKEACLSYEIFVVIFLEGEYEIGGFLILLFVTTRTTRQLHGIFFNIREREEREREREHSNLQSSHFIMKSF